MDEHKRKEGSKFAAKYNITWLVYYEAYTDVRDAIAREKQIKRWRRSKKVALIESMNPVWRDLSADW
jgi:putative endonuclease